MQAVPAGATDKPLERNDPGAQIDLVVVGGGIAGLVAALRASELGLAVVVLEQGTDPQYPCNTRFSGGLLHAAFRDVTRPFDELLNIIHAETGNALDNPVARTVAQDGRRLLSWLRGNGVRFMRFNSLEAYRWGMAPPRPISPGIEWKGRGPDVMLRTLTRKLLANGGAIELGAGPEFVMADDCCVGVQGVVNGVPRTWRARGVVIADGGFQANPDLFRKYLGPRFEDVLQRGAATGRGDGLMMAQSVGAAISGTKTIYGHLQSRDALSSARAWPSPDVDAIAAAGLVVGREGLRICDEGRGAMSITNFIVRSDDPAGAVAILDSGIWNGPATLARAPANPLLEKFGSTVLWADTIEQLARRANLPAQALADTIKSYNEALRSNRLDRLTPPRSMDKAKAWPIEKPPFAAIPMCAGITFTMGGIVIDGDGRVLREDHTPIPGLYAAGATTTGLEGYDDNGGRVAYIGGLIKSVFGLRAAESLAAEFSTQGQHNRLIAAAASR